MYYGYILGCILGNKIKSIRNKTVQWLESQDAETLERNLKLDIPMAPTVKSKTRQQTSEVHAEIILRMQQKEVAWHGNNIREKYLGQGWRPACTSTLERKNNETPWDIQLRHLLFEPQ